MNSKTQNEIAALRGQVTNLNAVLIEAQKRVSEFESEFANAAERVGHNISVTPELFSTCGDYHTASEVLARLPKVIANREAKIAELAADGA